jgi:hypothetical protein
MKEQFESNGVPDAKTNPKGMGFFLLVIKFRLLLLILTNPNNSGYSISGFMIMNKGNFMESDCK